MSVVVKRSGASPSSWLTRHEKFVRAICMIALYVSGAVFLVALLALGGMSVISGILLGIFVAALSTILTLYALTRRRS